MVYYGSDVFPTLKRGQHLTDVNVYTAPDNTEKFDKAFKALNGELNLLNGSGARMLVIASDGQYTPEQRESARKWLKACTDNGVAVVWLEYDGSTRHVERLVANKNVQVVSVGRDVTESADIIGKASATALARATAGK
jgi:oligoribonuclease NrnB/cAMP/cGMP phosphodiesterase (DHH superfamily)